MSGNLPLRKTLYEWQTCLRIQIFAVKAMANIPKIEGSGTGSTVTVNGVLNAKLNIEVAGVEIVPGEKLEKDIGTICMADEGIICMTSPVLRNNVVSNDKRKPVPVDPLNELNVIEN